MRLLDALAAIGPLLEPSGKAIADLPARVAGKRVGLYFSAGWCPMCVRFEPALLAFREEAANAGTPIELIYVSSDGSADNARARAQSLQCTSIPIEYVDQLKKQHRVWSGREAPKLGAGRRSGVPAVVVLSPEGDELAFVDAESRGAAALKKWNLDEGVF